jgi:deazaflavin-dependent oxidoreductase (nitroreductase family)
MSGRYQRLIQRIGHERWFAAVGRAVSPVDAVIQRRSGGRLTILGSHILPQLLLTTTGRTSGQPRTVPLLYGRHGDDFIVVASNWGQPKHPAWSANLLAEPAASIEVDGRDLVVKAELVEGSKREQLWPDLLRVWPAYDTYEHRSGRVLRVFLLRVLVGSRAPGVT